jgi:hypothetical protein
MLQTSFACILAVLLAFGASLASGQETQAPISSFPLNSLRGLDTVNGRAEITTYLGRPAVQLVRLPDRRRATDEMLAILTGHDFKDGTIEVDVAGSRRADSAPDQP